ncbi:MAG: TonB-dependent receptor, partial [Bacteroidota bacterium]
MAKFFTSGQLAGLKYLLTICLVWLGTHTFGQGVITGSVSDNQEGTPLVGARVVIEGTRAGSLTDGNGNFSINAPSNPPFNIIVTYFGYDTLSQAVSTFDKKLKLKLSADSYSVEEVVITSTLDEKKKQAALTMESLSINAIKETPSLNFYDGLGALREVDLTAASIGFKVINTRGFNSAAPVRSLQIIDGVDNQSPGLNFSLGNFLGASDLDVEQVDLIVGASSAYYGPNAFNGVISMKTKNPFVHRGLSVSAKVGERNLGEIALRYAKVFKNKAGKEKLAFKINA